METVARLISVEEFLAGDYSTDDEIETRYEYIAGRIRAMAGTTRAHAMLVTNLGYHAKKSAGPHCAIYTGGWTRVEAFDAIYIPDVIGACSPDDDMTAPYITTPCFIVEILSPSSTKKDRREKLIGYLTLPSLEQYAIVDQRTMRIEVFRRETGPKHPQVLDRPEHILELSCIGLRVALKDIYDRVPLPPLAVRAPSYGEEEDEALV